MHGCNVNRRENIKEKNILIKDNKSNIARLCEKHKIKKLYLIGSAARNRMTFDSDIDLLYFFKEDDIADHQYADNFFDFENSLEELLKTKIDLVAQDYLKNPYFIKEIEKDKILLYEA